MAVDTTEQIYDLVKQWCFALNQDKASEALRQIATIAGCISDVPEHLNEKQSGIVIKWLQENYPNTYLWAIGQLCIGHPAGVWGMAFTKSPRAMSKIASSF